MIIYFGIRSPEASINFQKISVPGIEDLLDWRNLTLRAAHIFLSSRLSCARLFRATYILLTSLQYELLANISAPRRLYLGDLFRIM